MDIIKISLLGVCGVILGFLMKGTKPEYACFITVGIGLVIMGLAVVNLYIRGFQKLLLLVSVQKYLWVKVYHSKDCFSTLMIPD